MVHPEEEEEQDETVWSPGGKRAADQQRPVPRKWRQAGHEGCRSLAPSMPGLPVPRQEGQGESLITRIMPVLLQLAQDERLPVPLQAKQVFQRPGTVNGTVPSRLPVPPHLRHSSPPQSGHTIVLMAACPLPERPGPPVVRAGPRRSGQGSPTARAGA